jgi:putative ABC transport system permease protein
VEAVSPRVQFGTGIYRDGNTYPAVGLGVDFEREREFQDFEDTLIEGSLPENGKNEVVLGVGLAKEIGLDVGDNVTLLTKTMRGGTNALTLEITGLLSFPVGSLNSTFFIAPLDRMQYFLRMNDGVTDLLIKVENRMPAEDAAAEIRSALTAAGRDELEVRAWNEISETYSVMKIADTSYMIIAFLFFLLGSTVIINTTMMVVYERTKEIGTIAAMGMTGPEIVKLFFLEALFISILGSLLGVAAGIGITVPVSKIGLSFGNAMEGIDWEISPVFYPVLNLRSTVFVFIYSTVIASAASFIPSRRAAKIKPVEALRAI